MGIRQIYRRDWMKKLNKENQKVWKDIKDFIEKENKIGEMK